jgi:Uma2 family endonuclease
MATTAGISLEQFLAMHFDSPEPDFVDGEVVERTMPDSTHAGLQMDFGIILSRADGLRPYSELRVRMAGRSYIIDLCAYPRDERLERFPTTPPIVAAEILSKDDRATDVNAKLDAYCKWGVRHVWLIDPWFPQLSVYDQQGLHRVSCFEIPEFGVRITLEELMAGI